MSKLFRYCYNSWLRKGDFIIALDVKYLGKSGNSCWYKGTSIVVLGFKCFQKLSQWLVTQSGLYNCPKCHLLETYRKAVGLKGLIFQILSELSTMVCDKKWFP